jgi:hypothetical protein
MHPDKSMNTMIRLLFSCTAAGLLCSCAATSVKKTWKSPACTAPVGTLAVIAVDDRPMLREGFENRFVTHLAKAGAQGVTTYDLLPLAGIKQDKAAAAQMLRGKSAAAVLIVRMLDNTSFYHEVQPWGEHYTPWLTGMDSIGWGDCFSVPF